MFKDLKKLKGCSFYITIKGRKNVAISFDCFKHRCWGRIHSKHRFIDAQKMEIWTRAPCFDRYWPCPLTSAQNKTAFTEVRADVSCVTSVFHQINGI